MKINGKILLLVVGMNLFSSLVKAQNATNSLEAYIKQNIDTALVKEKVPGILVAVLNNGERSYYTAGYAKPDSKLTFDSATIFEIGSITKTFTAYVLMSVLLEKGISDADEIIAHLPDSVQKNKNLKGMSFLSLMNHTSGLPRLPGNMKIASARQPYENYTEKELYGYLVDCSLKPDGKSNYSNLGAGLAGVLAERISGKSYDQLLNEYIFVPFKIIKADSSIADSENKSQGYFAANDATPYWNMEVLTPAGGIKSNGSEMLTYLQNMCFPQTVNSKMIVDKLTTETIAINKQVGVARAWHTLNEKDKSPLYWHNGGTYGFSTFSAFSKDKSKAVLVIVNQYNKNAVSDGLGFRIIKKISGED